jgi:hypothetical protein
LTNSTVGSAQILRRTQPWIQFSSMVGFLMAALMASFAVDGILGGLAARRFETVPFLLVYVFMSFVFFVPSVYLYKYSRRINTFVAQGHLIQLEGALEAQRKFWKFTGMIALAAFIVLALIALLSVV